MTADAGEELAASFRRVGVVAKASQEALRTGVELEEWLARRGLEVHRVEAVPRSGAEVASLFSGARPWTSSSCSAATARCCRWRARFPAPCRSSA